MTMTVDEIREHAGRLQTRLDEERHKVQQGEYRYGAQQANLDLILALEGRITELLKTCDELEFQAEAAAFTA